MSQTPLRIVFAGTPDFAASHLEALISGGFQVVSAYSQPDRPTGRGKKLLLTPVKAIAETHGIPVNQPLSLTDPEALATLSAYAPDVMVVVAYGLLLPRSVLALPRYGCLNVHASLLPRWRGAAPIERAILAGDNESGVCIMQMEAGLDTGPVLKAVRTPIQSDDSSASLGARLQQLGCEALIEVLHALPGGTLQAQPQDSALATYARKLQKEEAKIDWAQDASTIHNQVRALYPRSPAWCLHQDKRVRLIRTQVTTDSTKAVPGTVLGVSAAALKIACGNGVLEVFDVQTEGKPA
ncbi:MAG: methionyl-tRNA formyltransferase, partial [Pseudomonadota bacterium]